MKVRNETCTGGPLRARPSVWLLLTCHWSGLHPMAPLNWTKGWQTEKKAGLVNMYSFLPHTWYAYEPNKQIYKLCSLFLNCQALLPFLKGYQTDRYPWITITFSTQFLTSSVLKNPLNTNLWIPGSHQHQVVYLLCLPPNLKPYSES